MRRTSGMFTLLLLFAGAAAASAPDIEAAQQAIRDADLELCKATQAKDKAGFLALLEDDVVSFPDKPVLGKDKFLEGWARYFAPEPGPTLTWAPVKAEVFPTGDLGYTVGRYESKGKDKEGHPRVAHGTYLTVWRKSEQGAWKMAVDIGTGPEPEPRP